MGSNNEMEYDTIWLSMRNLHGFFRSEISRNCRAIECCNQSSCRICGDLVDENLRMETVLELLRKDSVILSYKVWLESDD